MDKQDADQVSAINRMWKEVNSIFGFTGGKNTHGKSDRCNGRERQRENNRNAKPRPQNNILYRL